MTCRHCATCAGLTHHWLAECEVSADYGYTHGCAHCDAVGFECDWCEGWGVIEDAPELETPCDICQGEGVRWVAERARCAACAARLTVPPREEALLCADCAGARRW